MCTKSTSCCSIQSLKKLSSGFVSGLLSGVSGSTPCQVTSLCLLRGVIILPLCDRKVVCLKVNKNTRPTALFYIYMHVSIVRIRNVIINGTSLLVRLCQWINKHAGTYVISSKDQYEKWPVHMFGDFRPYNELLNKIFSQVFSLVVTMWKVPWSDFGILDPVKKPLKKVQYKIIFHRLFHRFYSQVFSQVLTLWKVPCSQVFKISHPVKNLLKNTWKWVFHRFFHRIIHMFFHRVFTGSHPIVALSLNVSRVSFPS